MFFNNDESYNEFKNLDKIKTLDFKLLDDSND